MKATITPKGKIEIDLTELCDSLSDDDRKMFFQSVVFQESLLEAVCDTVATGQCFDGWYIGDMDQRLRMKLLPLLPEAVQELVRKLLQNRDSANAELDKHRKAFARLSRHWPAAASPNHCIDDRPEYCHCSWTQSQVEAFLVRELGEGWKETIGETANA